MTKNNNRNTTYNKISKTLESLNDESIVSLVDKAQSLHSGIGGASFLIDIGDTKVFVKKIPVSDFEKMDKNIHSTANIFRLPLFYQYGIGSTGFGVWRELESHKITTKWVLSGSCPNFPILYHWRLCNTPKKIVNNEDYIKFKKDVNYWENNSAIQNRLEEIQSHTTSVLLFLEYFPYNLYDWLGMELGCGSSESEQAVKLVENDLQKTNQFMTDNSFLHMDAHFHNILTDGNLLYFSDFGLSLSNQFDLSQAEIDFFDAHKTYDQVSTHTNLLHSIISSDYGTDDWEVKLQECIDNEQSHFPKTIDSVIKRYAPIAFIMDKFYQSLIKLDKSTNYPKNEIERLLSIIQHAVES